jgi:hypothetical protein
MVAPVAVFGVVCRTVLLLMGNNSEVSFIINSFSGASAGVFQTFDRATVGGFSCSLCADFGAVSRLTFCRPAWLSAARLASVRVLGRLRLLSFAMGAKWQ